MYVELNGLKKSDAHGLAGNLSTTTNYTAPSLSTGSIIHTSGCIFSYSGSSPIYTSGSTVLPPLTSGQPSRTIPCGWFLTSAYQHERTDNYSLTPSNKTSTGALQSPQPTNPGTLKYKDPNLTGCYAGTCGSATFTLIGTENIVDFASNTYSSIIARAEPYTFACSEFFGFGSLTLPWRLKIDFAESPVCASYALELENWSNLSANDRTSYPDLPVGVVNGVAH